MVKGIDRFRAHFEDFSDRYVLIGGAACYLALDEAGLEFRATKDLDIVLCVEALDTEFAKAFWDFVELGKYKNTQKSSGKKLFYRFYDPEDATFPYMLELFSRIPDALKLSDDAHLTPIPVNEEQSSLSAILLDKGYYDFIRNSKIDSDGIPTVPPEIIVPLKARAWLDLIERRDAGKKVDEHDIKKHKNDIFRLFQVIEPDKRVSLPDVIKGDMQSFLEAVIADPPPTLKPFGLGNTKFDEIVELIRTIYELHI
jgi:hypothetical protein